MKRKIKWEKYDNNIVKVTDEEGNDVEINAPFVQTPFGNVQFKIFAPEKNNLNFWCGHTNFDISGEFEWPIILDTPGVEIADLFSPYRFRICIGDNFKEDRVKRNLEIRLGCRSLIHKNSNIAEIKKLKLDLEYGTKPWLIYILPNGKYEYFVSQDKNEFVNQLNSYNATQSLVGGKILYGV